MKENTPKSKLNFKLKIALTLLTIFFGISAAQAATFTVTNTNDSGSGSLREAIIEANSSPDNDTIEFNLSGCPCTITLTSGDLQIANNGTLTINGLGADQLSVSGNNTSRVFYIILGANVTINGITVTGGNGVGAYDSGYGGGIMSIFSHLTLNNSTLSGNLATVHGGGVYAFHGDLTMINSTVAGNSAGGAGGGVIVNGSGRGIITGSTISGNTAASGGGGIWDSANYGVSLINTTVSGNSTNVQGGGVYTNSILTLTNATITGNSANTGGGVFSLSGSGNASAGNTIMAGNTAITAPDASGSFNSQGYNLIGIDDGSSGFGTTGDQVGTSVSPINAMLLPLDYYGGPTKTHALAPSSPAIDAGNSSLLTDQRGFMRPVDVPSVANAANGSDIGAFEMQVTNVETEELIEDLIELVVSFDLHHGIEKALLAKLYAALGYFEEGNTFEAIESIQSFINHVQAQTGKKITTEQADALIAAAEEILEALEQ